MILIRNVFQAKWGRSNDLVHHFRDGSEMFARHGVHWRILTDLSGPLMTVVTEAEYASLGDFERQIAAVYSDAAYGPWAAPMSDLVDGARREIFTVQQP